MKKFFILAITICRILTNSCYAITAEELFGQSHNTDKTTPWGREWITEEEWTNNLKNEVRSEHEDETVTELLLSFLWLLFIVAWVIIVIKKD